MIRITYQQSSVTVPVPVVKNLLGYRQADRCDGQPLTDDAAGSADHTAHRGAIRTRAGAGRAIARSRRERLFGG